MNKVQEREERSSSGMKWDWTRSLFDEGKSERIVVKGSKKRIGKVWRKKQEERTDLQEWTTERMYLKAKQPSEVRRVRKKENERKKERRKK